MCDITDGEVYKQLKTRMANCKNIVVSMTLNTDGLVPFNSSTSTMWPVLLSINELPFAERKLPKNILLAGLWFAKKKPVMGVYLKPVIEMLRSLETTGIILLFSNTVRMKSFIGFEAHPPALETPIRVNAFVIASALDLPARALVLNFTQFNGFNGCSFCEQPGCSFGTSKGGHVHVYPYIKELPAGPPRTHQQCCEYSKEASAQQLTVCIYTPIFQMLYINAI